MLRGLLGYSPSLKTAAGASVAALAARWIGRAEKASKLVFVPTEDLNALDPVIGGPRSMRNDAYLVFDTLYRIDFRSRNPPAEASGAIQSP